MTDRWRRCERCGARYRSARAARLCCSSPESDDDGGGPSVAMADGGMCSDGTERNPDCEMPECVGGPSDETHLCKDPGDEPLTICESCLKAGWEGAVEVLD